MDRKIQPAGGEDGWMLDQKGDWKKEACQGLPGGSSYWTMATVTSGISEAQVNEPDQVIRMMWFLAAVSLYTVMFSRWPRCLLVSLAVIKICPQGFWNAVSSHGKRSKLVLLELQQGRRGLQTPFFRIKTGSKEGEVLPHTHTHTSWKGLQIWFVFVQKP